MRTPGDDRALAAGFLLSEGVVRSADDIGAVEHCRHPNRPDGHNVVDVYLFGESRASLDTILAERREVLTNSSCGLCGRLTIDSLKTRAPTLPMTWTMTTKIAAATSGPPAGASAHLRGHWRAPRRGTLHAGRDV